MLVYCHVHRLHEYIYGHDSPDFEANEIGYSINSGMYSLSLQPPDPSRLCDPDSDAIPWILLNIVSADGVCIDGLFLTYSSSNHMITVPSDMRRVCH